MNRKEEMELADAIEKADWSGASIGNKVMLQGAVAALRASAAPEEGMKFVCPRCGTRGTTDGRSSSVSSARREDAAQ